MSNVAVEVGAWLLRRRRRFRVTGESMEPTILAGAFVLVDPTRELAVDDIVVAIHPDKGIDITKRVSAIDAAGVHLASDNAAAGQDSRHFGPVLREAVHGVVTQVIGART